ncbi:Asd/ArgC dimerization domain-containing protein, partial [Calditrichota bacterium]
MIDDPHEELYQNPDQSEFPFMGAIPRAGAKFDVAIVGARGLVGETVLRLLYERSFPIKQLSLYTSKTSAGEYIDTVYGTLPLLALDSKAPPVHEIVFMAAGAQVSKDWAWRLARRGAKVIDKTSYFRMKEYAPLVVPEVNPDDLFDNRGIFSTPNCSTIPLVMALHPLNEAYGLRKVTVATYQSVSGAGKDAMAAMDRETVD